MIQAGGPSSPSRCWGDDLRVNKHINLSQAFECPHSHEEIVFVARWLTGRDPFFELATPTDNAANAIEAVKICLPSFVIGLKC